MKSLWVKAILPVLVVAQFVACGKKNEDRTPVTTSRATKPQATPQKLELPPAQSPQTGSTRKPAPEQAEPRSAGAKPGTSQKEKPASGSGGSGVQTGAPAEASPAETRGQERAGKDGAGQAEVVDFSVTKLGTKYTAAGDDYFRGYMMQKIDESKDAKTKTKMLAAAESVQRVRFNADRQTGDVAVNLLLDAKKGNETVLLGGTFEENGIAELASAKGGIKGTLVCLDRDQATCYTAHLSIVMPKFGKDVRVHIISRKTTANFDYKFPTTQSGNREFARFVEMLSNTEKKNGELNSLRNILVESFEILGGRSGMKLSMISNEGETIVASGPLLGSEVGGMLTNVRMSREPFYEDLADLQKGQTLREGMQRTISEIRLIGNDGRKTLIMSFKMRAMPNSLEESLQVTFVRQHNDIMTFGEYEDLLSGAKLKVH